MNKSDDILKRARESGMDISEAQLKQMEGPPRHGQVARRRSRLRCCDGEKTISEGMAIARETYRAGQTALKERDSRRIGLAISLITILVTMLGVWLAIRSLEAAEPLVPCAVTGRKKNNHQRKE